MLDSHGYFSGLREGGILTGQARLSVRVLLLTLASVAVVVSAAGASSDHVDDGPTAPNIVLILTDNQRFDSLWAMRNVQEDLVDPGVTFSNGFVVDPLCCPSRATILTGTYAHAHRVYANQGRYGGFRAFKDKATIAKSLDTVGYRTGLVGKYLNSYNRVYTPPGWDRWVAFFADPDGANYYNYVLNVDGEMVHYGSAEADYSTDVLAGYADDFIRTTEAEEPLFLYFAPKAPHTPTIPALRHMDELGSIEPYRPPSYNEEDVTDKPAWVQDVEPWNARKQFEVDKLRKDQLRTLLSVDDAVGTIVTALEETDRLEDTLIVFTSDNAWMLGEHRWDRGQAAYEESIRVPLVVRWDAVVEEPRVDDHLVLNLDLAPTFSRAGGAQLGGVEGLSFVELLLDPESSWRGDFLVENMQSPEDPVPTYCAVRSALGGGISYVRYVGGEEELYDLAADPYQLVNVAADPGYATELQQMRGRMFALCSPPPPGLP